MCGASWVESAEVMWGTVSSVFSLFSPFLVPVRFLCPSSPLLSASLHPTLLGSGDETSEDENFVAAEERAAQSGGLRSEE